MEWGSKQGSKHSVWVTCSAFSKEVVSTACFLYSTDLCLLTTPCCSFSSLLLWSSPAAISSSIFLSCITFPHQPLFPTAPNLPHTPKGAVSPSCPLPQLQLYPNGYNPRHRDGATCSLRISSVFLRAARHTKRFSTRKNPHQGTGPNPRAEHHWELYPPPWNSYWETQQLKMLTNSAIQPIRNFQSI